MAKKNAAIDAVEAPAGGSLPRLTDVLAALGLINAEELQSVAARLIELYPDGEHQIRLGLSFVNEKLSNGALDAIRTVVWAEAVEAIKTGKSVIVHDPVDLA